MSTPNPKRTKSNSIAQVKKWDDTYEMGFFVPDGQILNAAVTLQKCKNNRVVNNCFFPEVSNNEN